MQVRHIVDRNELSAQLQTVGERLARVRAERVARETRLRLTTIRGLRRASEVASLTERLMSDPKEAHRAVAWLSRYSGDQLAARKPSPMGLLSILVDNLEAPWSENMRTALNLAVNPFRPDGFEKLVDFLEDREPDLLALWQGTFTQHETLRGVLLEAGAQALDKEDAEILPWQLEPETHAGVRQLVESMRAIAELRETRRRERQSLEELEGELGTLQAEFDGLMSQLGAISAKEAAVGRMLGLSTASQQKLRSMPDDVAQSGLEGTLSEDTVLLVGLKLQMLLDTHSVVRIERSGEALPGAPVAGEYPLQANTRVKVTGDSVIVEALGLRLWLLHEPRLTIEGHVLRFEHAAASWVLHFDNPPLTFE